MFALWKLKATVSNFWRVKKKKKAAFVEVFGKPTRHAKPHPNTARREKVRKHFSYATIHALSLNILLKIQLDS